MTKRKIVQDYEISEDYWTKIEPLLSVPKSKKSLEDLERVIGK